MIDFVMNPFTTDNPDCPVTYACEGISGPITDKNLLCDYMSTTGDMATFLPSNGYWGFLASDTSVFPPGQYIIQIYGSAGDPA